MQMAQPLRSGVSQWLRGTDFTPAAGPSQMALSTADPTYDISAIAEPVGAGYAQQAVSFDAPVTFGNVRSSSSDASVVFTASGGSWGTITHGVIYYGTDAYWFGELNAQKLVEDGNSISFAAGDVQLTAGLYWSDFSRDTILNTISGTTMTAASQLYLALSTTTISSDGSGVTQPSGGYARQPFTFTESSNTSAGIIVRNNAPIVFGPATLDWGSITHMAVYDDLVAGNMIMYGPVAASQTIVTGDSLALATNALAQTIS